MITGLNLNGEPVMGTINFAGGAAVVASLAASAAAASAAEVVALVGQATPTLISVSTTIAAPGYYVVATPGVTLTIGSAAQWVALGPVLIKDMTGAANPGIVVAATVDGSSAGLTLANAHEAIRLDWSASFESWLLS